MTDASFDPEHPEIIYLAQINTGLLKSYDSGKNWQVILPWSAANTPAGHMIKIAIGRQQDELNRTVAIKFDQEIFINRNGGRPQSDLNGGPWTSFGKWGGDGQSDWSHVIAVDPFSDEVLLAGAQELYRTADSGKSWDLVAVPWVDQQRVLFDPTQPGVVYVANDGGVFRSTDGGVTWKTDLNIGLVTTQFFAAATSGDNAVGSVYHEGLLGADGLIDHDWILLPEEVGEPWEFSHLIQGDLKRKGIFYVSNGQQLFRLHFPGPGPGRQTILDRGVICLAVDTKPASGVLLVSDNKNEILRCTNADATQPTWNPMPGFDGKRIAVAIAFCPSRPGQAYAMTDQGGIFVCTDVDNNPDWTERGGPPVGQATALAVSFDDENVLFAIVTNSIYRSVDGGAQWTFVRGSGFNSVPPGATLLAITTGPGALYVAANEGIFTSPDGGQNWFSFQQNLPNVRIEQLLWTESDLFAVTHGRGLWHHGRYEYTPVPPVGSKDGKLWFVEVWLAVHGGDPSPDAIRQIVGKGYKQAVQIG
ncbi:hypothetical protein AU476_00805 [Cupriavidus sp. UYMSc13B]|nr:hypothetical protein AU476_00805 [Cupriavidus sp. UYMSc13B]